MVITMAQPKQNPFMNPFENMDFSSWNSFADWNRMRDQFSRNIEAATTANQVALDCMRESARRSAEVMQKAAQHTYECWKDAAACRTPEDAQNRQADFMNSMIKSSFSNAKEMTEMASRAATEIVEICNRRMQEVAQDMSRNMNQQQSNPSSKK